MCAAVTSVLLLLHSKSSLLLKKAYISILFIFLSISAFSTHIVGGEIYYEYLGANKYVVTMKLYNDCINGLPTAIAADSIAYFGVFDSNGDTLQVDVVKRFSYTILNPSPDPCIVSPGNVCVSLGLYYDTITLPPKTGGYYIAYQRCCRNNSILNLFDPANTGATYFTHIPDPSVVTNNNSVHFTQYPPIFLCEGLPIKYDDSGTDPDNDSLVYQLCDTYTGLSSIQPGPVAPSAPPYTAVTYLAPYTGSYPMSSSPPLSIDPHTGFLTGTPDMIGQWVVGVCVSEYRKGVLIGTHHRDFQFNVIDCPLVTVSSIPSQVTFCFGDTVNFLNSSVNATSYHWDFGVKSLTNDTSDLVTPTYVYPDTGVYKVMLIANPGSTCADTATSTFKIYPELLPKFSRPAPQCVFGNSYGFAGTGVTTPKSTFSWDFTSDATPATSTSQNPTNIHFSTAGKHLVKFTISDHGCTQSYQDTVIVLPSAIPNFPSQAGQCINNNSFNFTGSGQLTGSATYAWSFGTHATPGNSTQEIVNGVTFNAVGKFLVTFTITDNGCTVSKTDTIIIYPLPIAKFDSIPQTGCRPYTAHFSDSSSAGTAISYLWKFGDGDTSRSKSPVHTYKSAGKYTVSLTIVTTNGCVDTLTFTKPDMIIVNPGPKAGITVDQTVTAISDPNFIFGDKSLNATGCKLFFGDGDSSLNCTSSHSYSKPGTYVVKQAVIDQFGCVDTTSITVEITPDIRFFIPDAFTPNNNGLNEFFMPVMDGVTQYHFMIFDRWGQLIFETNDQTAGWDGTYKKRKCQQDVYVYRIELTDIQGNNKKYVGHVTLLR